MNEIQELLYAESAYRHEITFDKIKAIKSDLITAQRIVKKEITLDDPKIKKLQIYKSGSSLIKTIGNNMKPILRMKDLSGDQEDFDFDVISVKKPRKVKATPILH